MHHNVSFKHIYSSILKGYHIWNNTRKRPKHNHFLKTSKPYNSIIHFPYYGNLEYMIPKSVLTKYSPLKRQQKDNIFCIN